MKLKDHNHVYFEFLKEHIKTLLKDDEVSSWVIEQELNLLEEFAEQL